MVPSMPVEGMYSKDIGHDTSRIGCQKLSGQLNFRVRWVRTINVRISTNLKCTKLGMLHIVQLPLSISFCGYTVQLTTVEVLF